MKNWRFKAEHSCSAAQSLKSASDYLEKLRQEAQFKVEVAPITETGPVMVQIEIMDTPFVLGLLFEDGHVFGMITAPKAVGWAESLVRPQIESMVKEVLESAGSTFVKIEYY